MLHSRPLRLIVLHDVTPYVVRDSWHAILKSIFRSYFRWADVKYKLSTDHSTNIWASLLKPAQPLLHLICGLSVDTKEEVRVFHLFYATPKTSHILRKIVNNYTSRVNVWTWI